MIIIFLMIWFYHVPKLSADVCDDSIQQEYERRMHQLGMESYRRLDEKYGAY